MLNKINLGICIAVLIMCCLFIRNNQVYEYRMGVIDAFSDAADYDIRHNHNWKWRQAEFDSVSYSSMVYQPWKPLKSFYKDKSFMDSPEYKGSKYF